LPQSDAQEKQAQANNCLSAGLRRLRAKINIR
jgi:hypothetical protein